MNPLRPRLWRHLLAAGISFLFLLPLYWMLVSSLREPGLPPPRTIEWWPPDPQWRNYLELFDLLPMARYLRNSLLVVAAAVPLTLLTASLAGFSLSQLPEKPRRQVLNWSVAFLLIPASAIWLFRFQILRWLGLIDSLWALIIPAFAASSPLFVLLYFWVLSPCAWGTDRGGPAGWGGGRAGVVAGRSAPGAAYHRRRSRADVCPLLE